MNEFLFNGLWVLGLVLAIQGSTHVNNYGFSEWQFWGWSIMFAVGSSMLMYWIRAGGT